MESHLLIGCKNCLEEVKRRKGFGIITSIGLMKLPIVIGTSYMVNDLYELFLENYTCPYCERKLVMSPKMMGFVNDYIHVEYHINFEMDKIEIKNKNGITAIDKTASVESIKVLVDNQNNEPFPSVDEIKEFLEVADDIDSENWIFRINSGHMDMPFYHKVMPQLKKDEYE